jgi:hypothetical protein
MISALGGNLKQKLDDLPIIGWREWVSLPELKVKHIKVKVDSGARTSSLHAFDMKIHQKGRSKYVQFKIHPLQKSTETTVNYYSIIY